MRIQVDSVSWKARDKTIIEDIDIGFEPGTFTGLLGPNGSGKTTLLNLIAGVRKPSAGWITADGRALDSYKGRVRARKIAMLEQHAMTNLDLSVRQVVDLGRIPHRGRWPGQSDEGSGVIDSAMKISRVTDLADRRWPTLSGGERQRTQLARALAQEPSLLLLDEPTNHLDLGHQIDFLRTVSGLGVTTIAALHDLELAAAFCDRLVVLQGGRVAVQGAVAEVMNADLLADVYGVDGTVEPHPVTGRPHLIWNDVIDHGRAERRTGPIGLPKHHPRLAAGQSISVADARADLRHAAVVGLAHSEPDNKQS